MKKLMTTSIFFLIIVVTVFSLNTMKSSIEKKTPRYVFLDSDFQKIKSTVSFFDEDRRLIHKNTYPVSGLEKLAYGNEKISSLSSYQSKVIEIDMNKKYASSNKTSRFPYPLFHWSNSENSISIYNYDEKQDMNYFTYEFSHHDPRNKSSILRRIGIPFASSVINDTLLSYTRDMDKPRNKQFNFSIVPTDLKNKIVSIPINKPLATRIDPSYYKENYYIMTEDVKSKRNTLITVNSNSHKLSFSKLSAKDCDSFDVNEKGVSGLHFSINSITFNQFDLKGHHLKEKRFNGISLVKSKFMKGQPYMIYRKKDKTFFGKINKNLKLVTIMEVHEDTNDFLVL